MITREELQRVTRQKGINGLAAIEKDYALSWALKAVYANPRLHQALLFKGGTCLSKVHAENYRLSEDLDFTLSPYANLKTSEISDEIENSFKNLPENAPRLTLKKDDTLSNPGYLGFKIAYLGPLNHPATIKLEIQLREWGIYSPGEFSIKNPIYSDLERFTVYSYPIMEIALEKIRAIIQRGKSRDYYDVWQLFTNPELAKQLPTEPDDYRPNLKSKCIQNNILFEPEKMFDENRLAEAKKYWEREMGRLMSPASVPSFEKVVGFLQKKFFSEYELTLYNNEMTFGHLDDIRRDDHSDIILSRAFELTLQKLSSKKKADVLNALKIFEEILKNQEKRHWLGLGQSLKQTAEALEADRHSEIRQSYPLPPLFQALLRLQTDRDNEIREKAKQVLETIQKQKL